MHTSLVLQALSSLPLYFLIVGILLASGSLSLHRRIYRLERGRGARPVGGVEGLWVQRLFLALIAAGHLALAALTFLISKVV